MLTNYIYEYLLIYNYDESKRINIIEKKNMHFKEDLLNSFPPSLRNLEILNK